MELPALDGVYTQGNGLNSRLTPRVANALIITTNMIIFEYLSFRFPLSCTHMSPPEPAATRFSGTLYLQYTRTDAP